MTYIQCYSNRRIQMILNFHKYMLKNEAGDGDGGGDTPPVDNPPTDTPPQDQPDWRSGIPEDIRSADTWTKFKGPEDVFKSYYNLEKKLGERSNMISIPDPKFATDDDYRELAVKMGLPEKLEDYSVTAPEGVEMDEAFMKEFAEVTHGLNIMPGTSSKLLKWYTDRVAADAKARTDSMEQENTVGLEALKKELGNAYEPAMKMVDGIVEKFGNADMKELWKTPVGQMPELRALIYNATKDFMTEQPVKGTESTNMVMSPEGANAKIREIQNDESHPYWNATHPNHQEAVKYMNHLFNQANPST